MILYTIIYPAQEEKMKVIIEKGDYKGNPTLSIRKDTVEVY